MIASPRVSLLIVALAVSPLACTGRRPAPSAPDAAVLDAAMRGDTDRLTEALAGGGSPNAVQAEGWSALMLAARAGHIEATRLLIARGADVDHANAISETALMVATPPAARRLIDAGADPHARNVAGATALFGASAEKSEMLLAAGTAVRTTAARR